MPRKTRYEQVPLEVVKRVVKEEIRRAVENLDPEQETYLAELKQQEKLLATANKSHANGKARKT